MSGNPLAINHEKEVLALNSHNILRTEGRYTVVNHWELSIGISAGF
jgi:hypothetical protein